MIIRQKQKANRGVTLVEIAIVLVIIGLLLGGVLKGQELINNAKVRSIADRQNSLKVAWFAFIDRFQAIPGDYINAKQHIPGSENGNGNGEVVLEESALAFQHMTAAGYLRCPQCTEATTGGAAPTAANSLTNQYGGVMSIYHDADSYATIGAIVGKRLLIHTGPLIPSNIISEVDRKIDDGIANTGDMVFNKWTAVSQNANVPTAIVCMAQDATASTAAKSIGGTLVGAAAQAWRGAQATPAVVQNCGASVSI